MLSHALVVIVLSSFLAMFTGKRVSEKYDLRWEATVVVQTVLAVALASASFGVESVPNATILIAGLMPASVTLYTYLSSVRRKRKALNGDYGEANKWATEIINDDDDHFLLAVQALPEEELMEVGIVADSKDELRDLTIERFENMDSEPVPEDLLNE